VEEGGGGEGGGARDTESKTRTPHKDVGKKYKQKECIFKKHIYSKNISKMKNKKYIYFLFISVIALK